MKVRTALVAALLSSLLAIPAQADDKAVATVNAQPVKQVWLDTVRQESQQAGKSVDDKAILASLFRNELLSQEAVRLGIDKREDFVAWQEIKRQELLANLLIKDHLKNNPVSEEMLKAEYENFKARLDDKEYSARHIQVKTEQEAKDVIALLSKGKDFGQIAREKSLDASSKDKGGLLGWVAKGMLQPPLGDTLAKLQKGLFNTVPVQTASGWHVLKLEDVRDLKAPPYAKVKAQLRQYLDAQQVNKLIDDLRAQAKIEIVK